jgi:hypothetical protein
MRQTRRSIGAFGDASNVKILKATSTLASKHSLRTHASALPHRYAVSWTEAGVRDERQGRTIGWPLPGIRLPAMSALHVALIPESCLRPCRRGR